jgi:hypothetical protein
VSALLHRASCDGLLLGCEVRREVEPGPVISAEAHAELFKLIKLGMELEHCCARLDLDEDRLRGDAELMRAIARAYRSASARLRAQLVEMAVKRGDSRALAVALEAREREAEALELSAMRVEPRAADDLTDAEAIEELRRLVRQRDGEADWRRKLERSGVTMPARTPAQWAEMREKVTARLMELNREGIEQLREELLAQVERHAQAQAAGAAEPVPPAAAPGVEVIPPRPRRMRVLDEQQPLPADRAPALPDRWRANWADSPWAGR